MKINLIRALFAVLLFQLASIAGAHAQTRTWVAGIGDDLNPCSRTAPCKTFAAAISKTSAGGIINCVDSGGYGTVTIVKSITIDCEGAIGGVLANGLNGITVSGAGIVVTLRNLSIEGVGTGLVGVNFANGASLTIDHCKIFGFNAGTATGVLVNPPGGVLARVQISDTIISDNGTAASNGGIVFAPQGTGGVLANLERVIVTHNSTGIRAQSLVGGGQIRIAMADSQVGGNTNNGITMTSSAGGAAAAISVHQSSVNGNGGAGVLADGGGSFLLLSNSMVTANQTAGVQAANGGSLLSIKNSMVSGNVAADGTTGPLTPQ